MMNSLDRNSCLRDSGHKQVVLVLVGKCNWSVHILSAHSILRPKLRYPAKVDVWSLGCLRIGYVCNPYPSIATKITRTKITTPPQSPPPRSLVSRPLPILVQSDSKIAHGSGTRTGAPARGKSRNPRKVLF